MNKLTALLLTALTFSATACDSQDPVDDADENIGYIEDNFEGPSDQITAPEGTPMVEFVPDGTPRGEVDDDDAFGIYEAGEAFVDDCNVCVKGKFGVTCTAQACGVDDRAVASCGGKQQGSVWAKDCNVCTCTAQGAACTINQCNVPNTNH